MGRKTQGTQLWAILPTIADPLVNEVAYLGCVTSVNLGSDKRTQIDDTCLEEEESTKSVPGLSTPGEASLGINADPKNAAQGRLYELLNNQDADIPFALGWAGSKLAPTMNTAGDGFVQTAVARTFSYWTGWASDFPFDFQGNSIVKSAVTIQRTSRVKWVRESA